MAGSRPAALFAQSRRTPPAGVRTDGGRAAATGQLSRRRAVVSTSRVSATQLSASRAELSTSRAELSTAALSTALLSTAVLSATELSARPAWLPGIPRLFRPLRSLPGEFSAGHESLGDRIAGFINRRLSPAVCLLHRVDCLDRWRRARHRRAQPGQADQPGRPRPGHRRHRGRCSWAGARGDWPDYLLRNTGIRSRPPSSELRR